MVSEIIRAMDIGMRPSAAGGISGAILCNVEFGYRIGGMEMVRML
jgi:hypothetical protein